MAKAFLRAYRKSLAYVTTAPAEEIAMREMKAGLFPGVNGQVLANTIRAYQQLGCWQNETNISQQSYENLLDVFTYSNLITRRHDYKDVVVQLPV